MVPGTEHDGTRLLQRTNEFHLRPPPDPLQSMRRADTMEDPGCMSESTVRVFVAHLPYWELPVPYFSKTFNRYSVHRGVY